MSILKGSAIDAFVRSPRADIKALLVYGSDSGRVRETAEAVVTSIVGSLDDPFRVTRLSDDQLFADPGLLADEARSLSFTGGRRVVWIGQAGRGFQKASEIYLADPGGEALIVAESGALPKTSKLRSLFETPDAAVIIACYEDTAGDLRSLAARSAAKAGLAIDEDALELLVERIGSDRAVSRSEIEKLLLYCHGRNRIEFADVEAVCGDVSALSMDELLDAALEGDAAEACRRFSQLTAAGSAPSAVLSALGMHVARLQQLRLEVDQGKAPEAAIKAVRPPLHFRRQARIGRQLATWPAMALDEAARTVLDATFQTRELPMLDHAIAERALLSLARKGQALRANAA